MRMSHKRTMPHIQVLTEMLQIIIQNLCSVSGLSMSTHYCRCRGQALQGYCSITCCSDDRENNKSRIFNFHFHKSTK